MTDATAPAGWYQDPTAPADGRYWDGAHWTDTVTRGGVTVQSPMDPNLQRVPPVPGTELGRQAPAPAAQQPARSSSTMTVLALVVAAAIGIGLVLFFFVGDDSSDDPSTPQPPATEAPATTARPTTSAPTTTS
jgi:hypothetical protein